MNAQRILRHIFHTRFTSYSGCFRAVQHLLKNHTAREGQGRADVIIETDDDVFIFEFKLDGSAEEALKQIVLILSARVIQRHMRQQVVIFQGRKTESENNEKFMKFYKKVKNISNYTILVFIALFFIIAIIEIIFVISGQGLDAPVKVFTDTADWTFSKQIPPPPLEHEGHYLCTVAAGGHERIVKPLRYGTRRGTTIVVNRQLCIANAFEELIQLKFPKFHRIVRYIYDTYGYPVSNLITSPLRADLIYIMMKPLEWIFLLVLYLLDLRPEQRIRNQYILQDEKYLRKRKTQVKKKRI